MNTVIRRLPILLAAPFIALAMLLGGLLALVVGLVVLAASGVAAFAFCATVFNLIGFAITHDPNALRSAGITAFWFVVTFSVPVLLGGYTSRLFTGRRAPAPDAAFEVPPTLRLELARPDRSSN